MRRILLLFAALAVTLPLAAQQKIPERPKLPKDLDTLDARAYYTWANDTQSDWKKKAVAFSWASRLDPDEFLYRVAVYYGLLGRQSPEWRSEYLRGTKYVVKSKEAHQIDSVWQAVLIRHPFPIRAANCYLAEGLERNRDRFLVGLIQYENGCYGAADDAFAEALAKDSSQIGIHLWRANASYYLGRYDQALVETQIVIDTLRARDAKYLTRVYESKEMLEYAVGMIHLRAGRPDAAREAFGRALTENLSFYMAHARLGDIALGQGRLQAAATEYGMAAELAPDDATMHYYLGATLVMMRLFKQAEPPLREAVRLEPYWAQPYFQLALALEGQEKYGEAVTEFEAFLARCPQRLKREAEEARTHLAEDREKPGVGGAGGPLE
jgi:tetratricopeptide (TPR) repeat protein